MFPMTLYDCLSVRLEERETDDMSQQCVGSAIVFHVVKLSL